MGIKCANIRKNNTSVKWVIYQRKTRKGRGTNTFAYIIISREEERQDRNASTKFLLKQGNSEHEMVNRTQGEQGKGTIRNNVSKTTTTKTD